MTKSANRKIDTIIFDFDGTLADTNQIIIDSWQHTFKTRTGEEGDLNYIMKTFGQPLYTAMDEAFPEHDLEETVGIYRDFQKTVFRSTIKAFPGIIELVRGLKEKGYKIGIVTARLRDSTMEGLEVFGILDCIDEIVTVEDTANHKPHPEPAIICIERLGSKPENSVMVGDSINDIGCGNNAGMETVMVGWSAAAKHQFGEDDEYAPDYIIEKAEDLWRVIS